MCVRSCCAQGYTPLHRAVLLPSADVVDELVEHSADLDLCTPEGLAALHMATTGACQVRCRAKG